MTSKVSNSNPRLEIKAHKSFNRFATFLYFIGLLGIPILLLKAFGPEAAGDTSVNGNSILAFWLMRVLLGVFWVLCLSNLKRSWHLMQNLPVLFILDKFGVEGRDGIHTPWMEFHRAYYVSRAWSLYLDVKSRSQFKNIIVKEEEIGLSAMEEVKSFIREHGPLALSRDL